MLVGVAIVAIESNERERKTTSKVADRLRSTIKQDTPRVKLEALPQMMHSIISI
jgi:hypothetical protein